MDLLYTIVQPVQDAGRRRTSWSSRVSRTPSARVQVAVRRDGSTLNVIAWHGCHDEAKFAAQLKAIKDLAESGGAALVLTDVNRRLSTAHASRASPLGVKKK